MVPVIVFAGLFSRELAAAFPGEEFREGFKITLLILTGFLGWGFAMYGHKGLELMEKPCLMLVMAGISALLNIARNFIFVPRCGYNGAALATCASYLSYPLLVLMLSRRYIPRHIPWRSAVLTILAAAGGSAPALKLFLPASMHPINRDERLRFCCLSGLYRAIINVR